MLIDLAVTPIAETLRRLAQDHQSGDLQVRSGQVAKTVFFDHGRVVFAASNLKKDRLGESLIAIGRITDEEFARASEIMRNERDKRFGDALVRAGVLDEKEVGGSVARQVERIVKSLFRFTDGAASFEERRCPIPLDYMVSLSLPRILYEGIRTMKSEALVRAGLGDFEEKVTLARVLPFRFDLAGCTGEEMDILEQAQRRTPLRRLVASDDGSEPEFTRLRATYALLASGVLDPNQIDSEGASLGQPPVIQMETGTFLLSALRRSPEPTTPEAILQEVQQELERSAHVDRETWLRVSESAPHQELLSALEEKMDRYHLLLETAGEDQQLKTDLEVIIGRAWTLLRALQQNPPDLEEIVEYVDAEPARPAAPLNTGPDSRQLLMEGEVAMTVSDYGRAVSIYTKLVELEPYVSAYRSRLAIAMASWPKTQKRAERQFVEALRLDPDNPDLHYRLALYYKSMKQRSRAIAELQAAVTLNPRHALARGELEQLSPRDNALSSLKKLFRAK